MQRKQKKKGKLNQTALVPVPRMFAIGGCFCHRSPMLTAQSASSPWPCSFSDVGLLAVSSSRWTLIYLVFHQH